MMTKQEERRGFSGGTQGVKGHLKIADNRRHKMMETEEECR